MNDKRIRSEHEAAPATPVTVEQVGHASPRVPTPLYVRIDPDNPKRVDLRFNTVEEAQLAWRLLGQMASDHADMIRAQKDREIADAAMHLRRLRLEHDKEE